MMLEGCKVTKLRKMGLVFLFIPVCMLFFYLFTSAASVTVPVIPGAAGFGMNTPAGRGGTVYKVTSLADTNMPGTLRYAINQKGPRVVVFEVSGTIQVDAYLDIDNPYITIAGQTAPSPGIFLRGAAVTISTHDVLLQHLRIAPGDDPKGVASENRDCLAIANPNEIPTNIVVDHCSLTWSVDESFSTWYPAGEITFSNMLVSEPLHDSIHVEGGIQEPHGFGPLFYYNTSSKITLTGNLISHCACRMPSSGSGSLVMVNNYIYDKVDYMTNLYNREGVYTKNSIVGNLFVQGPSTAAWSKTQKPINLTEILPKTRLYVSDNYSPDFPSASQWDLVNGASSYPDLKTTEPPVWNEGLTVKPVSQVKDWVVKNAGARPADRLSYETRIINNAKNGTGKMVNSIAEAGGWPVVAENYWPLTIPDDPNGDKDSDGYTNLEEWLHKYAAAVEGTGEPIKDPVTSGIPQIATPTPIAVTLSSFPAKMEAETDTVYDRAKVSTVNASYSGDGFVDYFNEVGGYIEWTLSVAEAGEYDVKFRYANGATDRPAAVIVNGNIVKESLSFPNTVNFQTWMESSLVTCPLKQGVNTIRLRAVGPDGGANLDWMMIAKKGELPAAPTPTPTPLPAINFTDVKTTDWFYDNVRLLVGKGIVGGYPDGSFKPAGTVQVDAFIKMTVTALGYTNIQNSSGYWATNYINKAKELKLVSEGEFTSYTRPITRGEMARMIARALTSEQYPSNISDYSKKISDYDNIKAEFKEYVLKAFYKGIITGYSDGTFKDSLNANRAEAATMIARLIDPDRRIKL